MQISIEKVINIRVSNFQITSKKSEEVGELSRKFIYLGKIYTFRQHIFLPRHSFIYIRYDNPFMTELAVKFFEENDCLLFLQ